MQDTLGDRMKKTFSQRRKELLDVYQELKSLSDTHPDIHLMTFAVIDGTPTSHKTFDGPNHVLTLWQHFGGLTDSKQMMSRIAQKNKFGIPGAKVSFAAAIYGKDTDKFMGLLSRAGAIVESKMIYELYQNILTLPVDIKGGKPCIAINTDSSAAWLGLMVEMINDYDPKSPKCGETNISPIHLFLFVLEKFGIRPKGNWWNRFKEELWGWFGWAASVAAILGVWWYGWEHWGWWFFGLNP